MAACSQDQKMCVGIDVSQDTLDIHVHPADESFVLPRTGEGIDELVRRLKNHEITVVALEATGGLELMVIAGLSAAGLPVVALNPKNVRGYATALGLHAKTDQIDAHVIARFAADVKPEIRPLPDAETQTLSEFMSRRRQLVQMIAAEKNRALRSAASTALKKSISRVIEALERELARLDGDIDKLVKASPVWLEKEKLSVFGSRGRQDHRAHASGRDAGTGPAQPPPDRSTGRPRTLDPPVRHMARQEHDRRWPKPAAHRSLPRSHGGQAAQSRPQGLRHAPHQ